MTRNLAALSALVLLLALPGCSKGPTLLSGSGALKMKDPVWATYGWSRNRLSYVIYFVPLTSNAFNAEGVAATAKISKDGDLFEGGFDGYPDKSKSPFKVDPKKGEVHIDGKMFRTGNGSVFLVQVGTPSKVQQLQVPFAGGPKDPEETPGFMESEVKRLAKEHPKIGEFPKEPAPVDKTKKK